MLLRFMFVLLLAPVGATPPYSVVSPPPLPPTSPPPLASPPGEGLRYELVGRGFCRAANDTAPVHHRRIRRFETVPLAECVEACASQPDGNCTGFTSINEAEIATFTDMISLVSDLMAYKGTCWLYWGSGADELQETSYRPIAQQMAAAGVEREVYEQAPYDCYRILEPWAVAPPAPPPPTPTMPPEGPPWTAPVAPVEADAVLSQGGGGVVWTEIILAVTTCVIFAAVAWWALHHRCRRARPDVRVRRVVGASICFTSAFRTWGGLNTGEATPVSPAALTTTADGAKGAPAISASDASLEMTRGRGVQLEREIGSGGFASVWLASYQVHAASPRGTDTLLASPLLCSPCMPRARRERRSPPSCSRTTRHATPSRARPTCCASYATRASASSSV